ERAAAIHVAIGDLTREWRESPILGDRLDDVHVIAEQQRLAARVLGGQTGEQVDLALFGRLEDAVADARDREEVGKQRGSLDGAAARMGAIDTHVAAETVGRFAGRGVPVNRLLRDGHGCGHRLLAVRCAAAWRCWSCSCYR